MDIVKAKAIELSMEHAKIMAEWKKFSERCMYYRVKLGCECCSKGNYCSPVYCYYVKSTRG